MNRPRALLILALVALTAFAVTAISDEIPAPCDAADPWICLDACQSPGECSANCEQLDPRDMRACLRCCLLFCDE